MKTYETGVWYGWNGGECPVHPESLVEAVWTACGGAALSEQREARNFAWGANASKIIAFRFVKEYREPREWWVHPLRRVVADYAPMQELGWIHVREVVEGGDA